MMKKLLIYGLLAGLGLISLSSCKNNGVEPIFNTNGSYTPPALITPSTNTDIVVTANNQTQNVVFKWKKADYKLNLAVSYTLTADSAGAKSFTLGSTNADSLVMSYSNLNDKLLNDGFAANAKIPLSVKISANLVNQKNELVSKTSNIYVTTYKPMVIIPKPAALYIEPGATPLYTFGISYFQDSGTGYYPNGAADSAKVFEEYLAIPNNTSIKFCTDANGGGTCYAYSGTPDSLTTASSAPGISVKAGYYLISVNISTKKYQIAPVTTWGLIGTATSGQWSKSTPMTYNDTTKVWEDKHVFLNAGALKFRANNAWTLNYGPASSTKMNGQLILTNGAVSIPSAGYYDVIIDLSKSNAPYNNYTYKIVSD